MALEQIPPEEVRGKAFSALWTFPSLLGSAFLVAWGAEAAQFLVSQGLALAMLAWLQTLPEFAVEAVIAWHRDIPLMTANFTGSLRLLTGVGWPMIFFVAFVSARRRGQKGWVIHLEREHCIEVVGLIYPLTYFWVIFFKGTLTLWDSAILVALYGGYLWTLNRMPPREMEDLADVPRVSRWVLSHAKTGQWIGTLALFVGGGIILYLAAHPFLISMLAMASLLGISQFVFVQWVSPFLSEFPEKVSAFNWARQITKAPMALMNMVSSNINQWTVLVAMIPIVYCLSLGRVEAIPFDAHQISEIHLTMAQGYLGCFLLLNMQFSLLEAAGLFVLWAAQFAVPGWREEITFVYWAWFVFEVVRGVSRRQWPPALLYYLPLLRKAVTDGKHE